ncbi:hypothetical protein RHGRI_009346 [Rhododendron griersonianum]|uniref:RING-type domain-containing protein n=1 Tax=Rhododendron griersonianum TaxID=479676 RepID=A0AAV6KEZ0_9ERIC|nr:hypothetical protein RHGRI_009346 [Rhododendron griersonianum]
MAVEARNLNLFPSQLIGNREMMSAMEGNLNIYNTLPPGYGLPPLSGTTTDTLPFPMYGSAVTDSIPAPKPAMKADSGLTYNFPVSRKRSRDSTNPLTEKVRMEMEEQRKRNSRRIIAAVEEGITKKLRAKEIEVEKIGKLNWALEERVKSLCVENQIWRELAQTNEATANSLRSNLEQVLAHVNNNDHRCGGTLDDAGLMDDAQSCCGSNYGGGDEEERTLADIVGEGKVVKDKGCENNSSSRMCRQCGKEESCVLLLPCRHLCLCTVCGSSVQACPVCNSVKNASLRVIMSS